MKIYNTFSFENGRWNILFPMNKMNILVGILNCFGFIFIWEYACLEHGWETSPSKFFRATANFVQELWEELGCKFAEASAIFTWFKLEKLSQALSNIAEPITEIGLSPIYFVKGYVDTANLYDHPDMVCVGYFFIAIIALYILTRFELHCKLWTLLRLPKEPYCALSNESPYDSDDESSEDPLKGVR